MKKMKVNEFEHKKDAKAVLQMIWNKYGGCGQCEEGKYDSDEIWAITNCNGFESVYISYDYDSELYTINVSHSFYQKGDEILEFIEKAKIGVV
jgi:hypothetical protein